MKNFNLNGILRNGSKLGLEKEEIKKILEYKAPQIEKIYNVSRYNFKQVKNNKKNQRDLYHDANATYGLGELMYYGSISIKDFQ